MPRRCANTPGRGRPLQGGIDDEQSSTLDIRWLRGAEGRGQRLLARESAERAYNARQGLLEAYDLAEGIRKFPDEDSFRDEGYAKLHSAIDEATALLSELNHQLRKIAS